MTLDLTNVGAARGSRKRGCRVLLAVTAAIALGAPAVATASAPIPQPSGAASSIPFSGPASPNLIPPSPRYLVVTVAFKGGGGFGTPASRPDITTSILADRVRQTVNPWFAAVSHGIFSGGTTTQVGPVFIQPKASVVCSPAWMSEVPDLADAEVRKQGFEPRNYQAVIFYFAKQTAVDGCKFDGAADFPEDGNSVMLNGNYTLRVLSHELGHNLGLGHAGSQFCADASGNRVTLNAPLNGGCTQKEYGDEYSAMGSLNPMGYSSAQLAQLGWNAGRVATISPDTQPVTRFLTPLEDNIAGSTQALHLVGEGSGNLWLEFRRRTGVDDIPGSPLGGGLLVRVEQASQAVPPARHVSPFLLDMTPWDGDYARGAGESWSPQMTVGQTWTNPRGNLKITLNSADVFGASVTIQSAITFKTVPDVRGRTPSSATSTITAAGLSQGTIRTIADPLCENLSRVITQTPAPGTRVAAGFPVDFQYGVQPLRGCPAVDQ